MDYSFKFIESPKVERNYNVFTVTCKVLITPDSIRKNLGELATKALSGLKRQMFDKLPSGREEKYGLMRVIHEGVSTGGESIFWCKDDFSGPIIAEEVDLSSPLTCIYISDPYLYTFHLFD